MKKEKKATKVALLGVIFFLSGNLMAQNGNYMVRKFVPLVIKSDGSLVREGLASKIQPQPRKEGSQGNLFSRPCTTKAEKVAKAMAIVETGCVPRKGASGEAKSIWQWMPPTWQLISSQYNRATKGVDSPLTLNVQNEEKVVVWKVQKFVRRGYTPKEIGMIWNSSLGGKEKPLARKGVNKHGVAFDSERHGQKVAETYESLTF